jgi:hypothetical protein
VPIKLDMLQVIAGFSSCVTMFAQGISSSTTITIVNNFEASEGSQTNLNYAGTELEVGESWRKIAWSVDV